MDLAFRVDTRIVGNKWLGGSDCCLPIKCASFHTLSSWEVAPNLFKVLQLSWENYSSPNKWTQFCLEMSGGVRRHHLVECVEIYYKRLIHSVVGKLRDQVSFPKVFIQLMISKHVSVFKAVTGCYPLCPVLGTEKERTTFLSSWCPWQNCLVLETYKYILF